MLIREIATSLTSFDIYSLFKDQQYSFFLDSGMDHDKLGQFSFIGADPFLIFKSKGDQIEIREEGKTNSFQGDPLSKLQELFLKYHTPYSSELPFIGGAVGYLGYDLCHYIEKHPRLAKDDVDIPDCYLGFYDGVIIINHRKDKVFVAALGIKDLPEKTVERMTEVLNEGKKQKLPLKLQEKDHHVEFTSNFSREEYLAAVRKVKEYIKAGDIYQTNLTQRFYCQLPDTPYNLYHKLRNINPAPFAGFIDFGEGYILSSSPERFIKIKDGVIETRPIKGTRPRGQSPEEDQLNREELLASEKDQAELLMIVDLERNDLGKVCKTGTVKVTSLFELEEYPTVYHLAATIQGQLKDHCDFIDCIRATFPGGSITGAPKIRAMEIIDELEPTQRNIYTGSMGYVGFNGDADLNIVIRTIVCKENKAFFQVGGGIVWDSQEELEYQETLDKGKALMKTLRS